MAQPKTDPGLDHATERAVAVALFNGAWKLIERENRTPDDDARMLHMAHASCFHWLNVGGPENSVRGEWMCSRVYALLCRPEPAMFHARRALDICERNGIGDWDLAFCHEAIARAHAIGGERDQAQQWLASARDAATRIADDEDRKLLLSDLDTIPG